MRGSVLRAIGIIIVFCVLLALPLAGVFLQSPAGKQLFPNPTPTPRFVTGGSVHTPVVRQVTSTIISYWLYGMVSQVEQSGTSLRITVELSGDPLKTKLTIVFPAKEGLFKTLQYQKEFGGMYSLRQVDSKTLGGVLADKNALFEFHAGFLRSRTTEDDLRFMGGLDAVNAGDWSKLPSNREIIIDSLGWVGSL